MILLVDLGIWTWSRPHYLVAYGWIPEGVVAHSGREQGKVIPFSTLDAQWAKMGRLAILVRRPGAAVMAEKVRLRSWRCVLPFLLVLLLAGGCSRIPRIIVLDDPLTAAEHVELGVAYERKGELDLARREYERALRKDGKFYRARVNLGNIFLAKKEYGKAREEYLLALELRPGDAEATNNLSWAAIFSGEGIDEALARMESVVSGPGGRRADPSGHAGCSPDARKPSRGGGGGLRPGRCAVPAGRCRPAGGRERTRRRARKRCSGRSRSTARNCGGDSLPRRPLRPIGLAGANIGGRLHAPQDRTDHELAERVGVIIR